MAISIKSYAEMNTIFCIPTPTPDPGNNRQWTHLEQQMNTLKTKTNTPKTKLNTLKTQIEHTLKTLEHPSILWFLESSLLLHGGMAHLQAQKPSGKRLSS